MPQEECKDIYAKHGIVITDYMICAMGEDKDACKGDSGGPLVYKTSQPSNYMIQVGIVSWGVSCAHSVYPAVYSRVSAAIGWINQNLEEIAGHDEYEEISDDNIDEDCVDVEGWVDVFGDSCDWYSEPLGDDDFFYGNIDDKEGKYFENRKKINE